MRSCVSYEHFDGVRLRQFPIRGRIVTWTTQTVRYRCAHSGHVPLKKIKDKNEEEKKENHEGKSKRGEKPMPGDLSRSDVPRPGFLTFTTRTPKPYSRKTHLMLANGARAFHELSRFSGEPRRRYVSAHEQKKKRKERKQNNQAQRH